MRMVVVGVVLLALAGCGDDTAVSIDAAPPEVDGAPPDTTAPTAGDPITFTNVAAANVAVHWGAATDDVTAVAALTYKVVRAGSPAAIDTLAEVAAITSGAGLVLDFTADTTTTSATDLASATAYAFAVIVKDAAGNEALYAPVAITTLDATLPTVTISTPTVAATYPTAAATIALGGTASDDVGITSVTWANAANGTSGAATGTTAWSVASVALVAGDNVVTITAADGAGNTVTDAITVTRDNAAPTVTITSPTAAATYPTTASTIALGGTAADNVGVASVVWANAANGTTGTAIGTTAWSVASVTLAAGDNVLLIIATDGAGNTASDVITVTRDNAAPTVTITSPTASATYATAPATIALGGTAADNVGVASVTWANAANATSGTATGTTAWSVASVTLVVGANVITVTATDAAGNAATDVITVTRDNLDPTVTITSPTASATYRANLATIALAGTASDNVGVTSVTWANAANGTNGAATGTTAWSVASVTLVAGDNVITVTATDGAGNTATDTLTVKRAATVAAGGNHACAVLAAGSVKCWGYNENGRLGLGDTANRGDDAGEMGAALAAVALGAGRTAVALTAGIDHVCALLDDGNIKCWGYNGHGQLGQGDTADRGDTTGELGDALPAVALGVGRTAVAVTAGIAHTCALLDDGTVKCWGANGYGQLGQGDTAERGDGAGEMGAALPAVALGAGRTAVAVAAGSYHSCALLDDGSVKCWGVNEYGQLGLGDTAHRGDDPGEMGGALPTVALGAGRTAVALTAAINHTCALLDDGTVKCWGYGGNGALGQGDTADRGDGPGEMGDALPAVALGTGRTAVALAAAFYHTCVVLDDGGVKCWGTSNWGQLGQGDAASRGDGPGEMGDTLPAIALGIGRTAVVLAAGIGHSCAALDDGSVKCWGFNLVGQLGLGDTANRGDAAGEMGNALPALSLF